MDASWRLLDREGSQVGPVDVSAILAADDGAGGGRRIVCRFCGRFVTSTRDRIDVRGAHEHTETNPAGMVFRIGCFREAPGCAAIGPEVAEDTWFSGYTWQIAICRGCRSHLGWGFSGSGDRFFGLIVDRLRVEDSPLPS